MQYALKVFQTEDHFDFRTIMRDGEPWFVLADVCRALDHGNPASAASRLDADEKGISTVDTLGGSQQMAVINESGLYSLILTSRKEGARRFKKWVTSVVLPTIRRTGASGAGPKLPAFFARYSLNQARVDRGHFSVIGVLAVHVYGRLEFAGHLMADCAPDGRENRPDVAVGRRFSDWLKAKHPNVADCFTFYPHWTSQRIVEARQYPYTMYPLFIEFLDEVWIPEHSQGYFAKRDPAALPHLPKLLPPTDKPAPGMMRQPAHQRFGKR